MTAYRSHTASKSERCDHNVAFRVLSLLKLCCPATVSWLIISGMIWESVQRSPIGPIPHIGYEILKQHPTFANCYSFPAVIFPRFPFWICASGNHGNPRMVSWAEFLSLGVTMREESVFSPFQIEATTGFGISTSECCGGAFVNHPAGAFANHSSGGVVRSGFSICDYFKSSKSLTDDVYFGRHDIAFFNIVFSGGRSAETDAHCDYYGDSTPNCKT